MSLQSQADLAKDPEFQDKVLVAMIMAAKDVASEVDNGYVSYQKRNATAVGILKNPTILREAFSWAVAANPALTLPPTDNDIKFTVNSLWDGISGVMEEDKTTPYPAVPVSISPNGP